MRGTLPNSSKQMALRSISNLVTVKSVDLNGTSEEGYVSVNISRMGHYLSSGASVYRGS